MCHVVRSGSFSNLRRYTSELWPSPTCNGNWLNRMKTSRIRTVPIVHATARHENGLRESQEGFAYPRRVLWRNHPCKGSDRRLGVDRVCRKTGRFRIHCRWNLRLSSLACRMVLSFARKSVIYSECKLATCVLVHWLLFGIGDEKGILL